MYVCIHAMEWHKCLKIPTLPMTNIELFNLFLYFQKITRHNENQAKLLINEMFRKVFRSRNNINPV